MKFFWIFIFLIYQSSAQIVFPDDPPTTKSTTSTTTTTTKPTTTSTSSITTTSTTSSSNTTIKSTTTSSTSTTTTKAKTTTPFIPQPVSICVPVNECSKANLINDGIDAVQPRMAYGGMKYNTTVGTYDNITTPASTGINLVVTSQTNCSLPNITELCVVQNGYQCGVQYGVINKAPSRHNAAHYGAYPWEGLVMRNDAEDIYTYYATGALIDHKHFLTIASKMGRFVNNPSLLRIRLGEWNLASIKEIIPYQEFLVSDVFIHPNYNNSTMANNIAVLRLAQNVQLGSVPTIGTACLPSNDLTTADIRCMVAGFGRYAKTDDANFVMRENDQPLLNASYCQAALRNTSLGKNYTFDSGSWLCAGGELQKSNCDGDEGNPLVCNVTGQFYVVGLYSWSPPEQNCGSRAIPQIYTNVLNFIPWIQSVTSNIQTNSSASNTNGKVQSSKNQNKTVKTTKATTKKK
ncbi:hypothetical protein PVAND_016726 [Polypedilum vanderplanki]|uniref:Peptidase S1 domain-containing protein n=1 Tax=Polypedilum vanderplanki TaxID=319348 RepID=A0A9J6BGM5_POLVA|nr:hypothetical protein PVAND_016726 [Polypedilum vanderplanki]